jgi:hypothetical protein
VIVGATAEVIVAIVAIAETAGIVVTDTTGIVIKAAVVAAVVTVVVTTTVINTRTLLLLLVPVDRARPLLLHPVLPPTAWLTIAHSMHSTTELTPMPPMVDTKTMSPTTNITKQPLLNSNSSNKPQRPLLLRLLRRVRHPLHLPQAQDPLPLLPVEPLAEEVVIARYVPYSQSPRYSY